MKVKRIFIPTVNGGNLCATYGCPDLKMGGKPLVAMLHDIPGHRNGNNDLFADLEHILVNQGYPTLRFDFSGCGDSDGDPRLLTLERMCEDVREILHWTVQNGHRQLALIGEGLGASIASMNMVRGVSALAMLWPALDLPYHARRALQDEDDFKALGASLNTASLIQPLQDIRVPTLIMHGSADTVVPPKSMDLARIHIPSERVEITTFHDGDYALPKLNHRKMMFKHIEQFLNRFAAA